MKILDDECSTLCRNSGEPVSLFHRVPIDNVEALSWKQAVSELQRKSPILLKLIQTIVGHSDYRNLHKRGESHYPGMCMATAILLKERNTRMCGIQSFLSLVYTVQLQSKQKGLYVHTTTVPGCHTGF